MRFQTVLLLAVLLLCAGCPYESAVPLSDPEAPIDRQLLGKWQKEGDEKTTYIVEEKKEKQYQVVEKRYNADEDTWELSLYRAHLTSIEGQHFLNVQPYETNRRAEENTGNFYLYKLQRSDSEQVVLLPLSGYIRENFDNSQQLHHFVQQNMQHSFFYGYEEVLRRQNN